MSGDKDPNGLTRRGAFSLAVGSAGVLAGGSSATASAQAPAACAIGGTGPCLLTPQTIEGPYYLNRQIVRSGIRAGRPGLPMKMQLRIVDTACRPIPNARVDVWHADAHGLYSGAIEQGDDLNINTKGETFLRGTQFTDGSGQVAFETIYPGWYRGRTTHVHAKVYLDSATVLTAQIYFPDALSDFIFGNIADYVRPVMRDTINATDRRAKEVGHSSFGFIKEEADHYALSHVLGVDPAARPPQGLEHYPPGPPPFGKKLTPDERIRALVPLR